MEMLGLQILNVIQVTYVVYIGMAVSYWVYKGRVTK